MAFVGNYEYDSGSSSVRVVEGVAMAKTEAHVASGINGFGASLRRRRRGRGWSQFELESRSGVDQGTISAIEVGRSKPTMETVRRLAGAFGLPEEELAREAGQLSPRPEKDGVSGPEGGDIFDRAPLSRLDAELKRLPTAPGQPTFAEQMHQLDRLDEERKARVIRRLARDFLWRLREELEREEGDGPE
jgi:transcriptional regulator with XRE-family HTH domain